MRKIVVFALFMCTSIFAKAQVPPYVPTSGLLGWWPFTGNAHDSSGHGNNGTITGATLTTDRFGHTNSAYSFNGTSSYIDVPYVPAFNQFPLTISAWIQTSSVHDGGVVSRYEGCSDNGYEIYLNGPGYFSGYYYSANGSNINLDGNSTISINDGTWKMLTAVFANDSTFLYVNGILAAKYQF